MQRVHTQVILAATIGLISMAALGQPITYSFTTIAGSPGKSGSEDGTGSDARFNNPCCVALDHTGNLYVTDLNNNTVRKLAPSGSDWVVTTIAGTAGVAGSADGTNRDASFHAPRGITADPTGNLYVADRLNHSIRKIVSVGADWVVSTIAGLPGSSGSDDGVGSGARFLSPSGIVAESEGRLYVADTSNNTIRMLVSEGPDWIVSTIAGATGTSGFLDGLGADAQFSFPYSLAPAGGTNLWVADWGNQAVRLITGLPAQAQVQTIAGFSGLSGYVDGPVTDARFNDPIGVAVDTAGHVFVSDQRNHSIRQILLGANGYEVGTVAGSGQFGVADGTGSQARFNKPWGIAVDTNGSLYVCDYANHTIRKGTPATPPPVVPPSLQAQPGISTLVISWPADAGDYVLERSPSLRTDAVWIPITNGISVLGRSFVLTNQYELPAVFYRLRRETAH